MSEFLRPKSRVRHNSNIMDEDQYLAKLERIIKRDFFPELKALEELRTGKPQDVDPIIEGVSLNHFLSNYTSDENQTFQEIIQREDQRWKEKQQWMYDIQDGHRQKQLAISLESNKLTNMIDGDRINKLMLCDYQAMNQLFFPVQCEEIVSKQTETDNQNEKSRKVVIENTRLEEHDKPFGFAVEQINQKLKDSMKEKLQEKLNSQGIEVNFFGSTPNLMGYYGSKQEQIDKYGHVDLEELMQGKQRKQQERKPQVVNGYLMLAMPSPGPNQLQTPLMTWGALGDTPLRIDRSYKIPNTPQRDQLASDLASQICNKKKTTLKAKQEYNRLLKKTLQGMTPHRLDTGSSRIGSSMAGSRKSQGLKSFLKPSPGLITTPLDKVNKKIKRE